MIEFTIFFIIGVIVNYFLIRHLCKKSNVSPDLGEAESKVYFKCVAK